MFSFLFLYLYGPNIKFILHCILFSCVLSRFFFRFLCMKANIRVRVSPFFYFSFSFLLVAFVHRGVRACFFCIFPHLTFAHNSKEKKEIDRFFPLFLILKKSSHFCSSILYKSINTFKHFSFFSFLFFCCFDDL